MTTIPASIGLSPQRAVSPDTSGVRATDFGLEGAGDQMRRAAEAEQAAQDREDDREAEKIVAERRGYLEPELATSREQWDPAQPGYAAAALKQTDDGFADLIAGEDRPGVRTALIRHVDGYKTRVGDNAIAYEGQLRAGEVRQMRIARETAELGDGLVNFTTDYAARQKTRLESYDGSQAGFADGVLEDFNAAAASARETLPEARRAAFDARMAERRVSAHAQAIDVEQKAQGAYVVRNYQRQAAAIANVVITNPAGYEQAVKDLDVLTTALPPAVQADTRREQQGRLIAARIEGLIDDEDHDQAAKELEDGRYDAVLEPNVKAQLVSRVLAAKRGGGNGVADYVRGEELKGVLDADIYSRSTTGRTSLPAGTLDEAAKTLGAAYVGKYIATAKEADDAFAAVGPVKDMSNTDLTQRLMAPAPDPSVANYAGELRAYEVQQKAAQAELKARTDDPALWAMTGSVNPQRVLGLYEGIATADDPKVARQNAQTYAATQLALQTRAGIPLASQRILPKGESARLVTAYIKAPPEGREAALQGMGALVAMMPTAATGFDGQRLASSPKAMLLRELDAAGLTPPDLSAVVDFADDPSRMALYAQASNNPAAHKGLPEKSDETALKDGVDRALADFRQSSEVSAGGLQLNAARVDRAVVLGRHLMTSRGMSASEAAKAATRDLTEGYEFFRGLRVPKSELDDENFRDAGQYNIQAGRAMSALTANGGANLRAPASTALTAAQTRKLAADTVLSQGRWVTREDDSGLALVVGQPGGYQPVQDKYGRPVAMSWAQLRAAGKPGYKAPLPWEVAPQAVPPAAVQSPTQAGRDRAFNAVVGALTHKESRGAPGAVSPKGALGLMQLMPGTAKTAAARLGVPFDEGKLLSDPAYNAKLGREELRFLIDRYDGNIALALAAYNAGPGNVDKWIGSIGDPRGKISVDEFVANIPFRETRDYVRTVLPDAVGRLAG